MRHTAAGWDWETDAAPDAQAPPPDDTSSDVSADAAADDAAAPADQTADAPLWTSADDHLLHLPPQGVDRILIGGGPPLRRLRPHRPFPRPGRRHAIRAVGRLVRGARRTGMRRVGASRVPLPVFRSRSGGQSFRIITRPRAGMRYEILSIEPESQDYELMEAEAPFDLEIEVPAANAFNAAEFIPRLGKEWSDRRNGNPAVGPMTAWLQKDHDDTVKGARTRQGLKTTPAAALSRAWAISRVEQMKFQLQPAPGVRDLVNFHPPATRDTLIRSPLVEHSDVAPVAPLTAKFVEALRKRYTKSFSAQNYRGHGGGSFLNRGLSLDIYINGRDSRGFFPPAEAIVFLRALHQASRDVGAEWRVLYNDFSVADAINRELGVRHVAFIGHATYADAAKTVVNGINWHGPDPFIAHFHLDLAPAAGVTTTPGPVQPLPPAGPPSPRPPATTTPSTPNAVLDAVGKTIVNMAIVFGERDPNKLANQVFFTRHPDRQGRALQKGEPNFDQLAREWTNIKSQIVMPTLAEVFGGQTSTGTPVAPPSQTTSSEVADALRIAKRPAGNTGLTIEALVEKYRQQISPEIPMPILLAFIAKESGGKFTDATHGTAKNGWTSPPFYELGLFQTPAGLHGKCTGGSASTCEFGPPGRETSSPSTWAKLCKRFSLDPKDWTNPVTQARVGLADLEGAAAIIRRLFPELFPKPGSDWDLRMAVLYSFSRGAGAARSFLTPHRQQLAAMPEGQRWAFLRNKTVTVTGQGGAKITREFHPENVEKKMALAAKLGYVAK